MTRQVVARLLLTFLGFTLPAACSGRRLPPGTPAPEYEPASVTPWPVAAPDAAAPTSPAADASVAPESAVGAQLSPDAGVR